MKLITDIVNEEQNCYYRKKYIFINQYEDLNIEKLFNNIELKSRNEKIFLLIFQHEVIDEKNLYTNLVEFIKKLNRDIRIVQSTASKEVIFGAHPFTHMLHWKYSTISVNNNPTQMKNRTNIFDKSLYTNKPNFLEYKSKKSIFSVNRKSLVRDLLVSKIDTSKIDIFRYNNVFTEIGDKSVEWPELINEYKSTYFSFICETNHGDRTFNSFTEKSILAFLTGNIPLIFGQKHLIKDLEKLGFWIPNIEFGFDDADEYDNESIHRVDKFSKCVNEVNEKSMEWVIEYYKNNLDKIYNNLSIVSDIFNHNTIYKKEIL